MTASQPEHPLGQFEGQTDIGSVEPAGSGEYDPGQEMYSLSGAGANVWGGQDDFHFVWKKLSGNFIVTARAAWQGETGHPHRKLGWMARLSLEPSAPHASAVVHGDGLAALQFRRTAGGPTEEVRLPLSGAEVIQLERRGSTFILSAARFGEPFSAVQVADLDLGGPVYLGLFVCSHEESRLERADFRDVRMVVPAGEGFMRGRDPFASRLEILELAGGHRQVIHAEEAIFEAPNWTRDGKALIYNQAGRLVRFDLASRTPAFIDTGGIVHNNNDHVLSFDGSRLAISSHSGPDGASRIYTLPLEGGQPRLVTPRGPSYLHGWSPDGKFLVYCAERNGQYDVYRIPAEGGDEQQLTNTPGLDDGPEYTPDGRYIYFNSVRSGSMQIWRMRPDGSQPEQLTEDGCNNWFAHVSPDGSRFVFVSYLPGEVEPGDHPAAKRVYLRWLPLDGGTPKVLAYLYGGQGTMNVPSWSPDGTRLAFVSNTLPYR